MIFESLDFEIFTGIIEDIPKTAFKWIEIASIFVEAIAIIIILFAIIYVSVRFIIQTFQKKATAQERFKQYKHGLAKALLLSLEILVAADVIRTVALEPALSNFLGLGLLVVIRTFLSWSLIFEMEGRRPWKPKLVED